MKPTLDTRRRALHDLRISVTDRCNFRCRYCMPREVFGESFPFLAHEEILTYEEIARLARLFRDLGVVKVRLTGGEPLLRRDLPRLVAMLREIPELDLALTTNGALLERHAEALATAGLGRVTVSLDSLDEEVFRRMNDADFPVRQVLAGIDAAAAAGLTPIKVNCVVQRGVNDHTVADLVRTFAGRGIIVRFIEYMDVGSTNGWRLDDVVTGEQIIDRLSRELELEPVAANYRGEVAKRWRLAGGGEIGLITSVSRPFCGDCSRARLSADGRLFTCLFAEQGFDLRALVRSGAGDDELRDAVAAVWKRRDDRYSELRTRATDSRRPVEMSFIGG